MIIPKSLPIAIFGRFSQN